MNSNIVMGILRAVVPGLVGYLVGKGLVPAGDAADLGAAIITIGAAVWSVSTNLESKATTKPTVATGGPSNMNAGIKGAVALFFAATALLTFSPARAADIAKASKPNLLAGYVVGQCGLYFGINTIGGAGSVNGGPPGASVIQGGLGGTVGYGCPIGTTPGSFWFAEGNFDWTNINGSQNGFSATGPAHFEQRVGIGSPISAMLDLLPGWGNGLSVPSLPALPAGVTQGPSYPFIFAALHEQDVSAQFGLSSNRQWLFSPGVGIGLESRLSNNVVAETAVQWVMQSNGLTVGPADVKLGNAVEVSFTLKY